MPLIRQLHPPPEVKFDSHEPFGVEFVVAQSKFNPLESCNPVLMLLLFTHSFSPLLCSAIREGRPSLLSSPTPSTFTLLIILQWPPVINLPHCPAWTPSSLQLPAGLQSLSPFTSIPFSHRPALQPHLAVCLLFLQPLSYCPFPTSGFC